MTREPLGPGAPRPSIARALQREPVVWLSTVCPDGRPHVVPVWFLWDDDSILILSKPDAQKVRNIRAEPRVMIAVGRPGPNFDVELIDAAAELAGEPIARRLAEALARKYARTVERAGVSVEAFTAIYSQLIWVRPTRWLGWGGNGWRNGPADGALT
jgi:PPOX class probable F420-dependent enzyme